MRPRCGEPIAQTTLRNGCHVDPASWVPHPYGNTTPSWENQPTGRPPLRPGPTHLGKHRTISFIRQQVAGGLMLTHPLGEAREGRKVRQSKIQFEGGALALHPSQRLKRAGPRRLPNQQVDRDRNRPRWSLPGTRQTNPTHATPGFLFHRKHFGLGMNDGTSLPSLWAKASPTAPMPPLAIIQVPPNP